MARRKIAKRAEKLANFDASKQHEFDVNDHISQLPDELLTYIESFFTLKERAITSLLSRKWRDVDKDDWTFTRHLIFDALEVPEELFDRKKLLKKGCKAFDGDVDKRLLIEARRKFANWINKVIKLNKAETIEEFKVCFYFGRSYKSSIDKWLDFALARKVKKLELNFSDQCSQALYGRFSEDYYAFPHKHLKQNANPHSWRIKSCNLKNFRYIHSLSLVSVAVTDDDLDYLLLHCPLLERFCIGNLRNLRNLKLIGPSVPVKFLEMWYCCNIESIKIRDTSLISFTYAGDHLLHKFIFENVQQLVEVHFVGWGKTNTQQELVSLLSRRIPHVETLTLSTSVTQYVCQSWRFKNLKQLILQVPRLEFHTLLMLISLIKASPYMQKFVLKLTEGGYHSSFHQKVEDLMFPHLNLEELELSGYFGGINVYEFVMYFLRNIVALRKVVIDTRHASSPMEDLVRSDMKQQLEGRIPRAIELIIL